MIAAVLYSGGKDSTMATYKALEQGWRVKYLVSMISENLESYMYHSSNINLTKLSAQAMNIPLIKAGTKGEKEEELEDLRLVLSDLKDDGVEAIFTGALASQYQKSRIDKLCDNISLKSCAPLWHRDPQEYMEELIKANFEVIIVSVSAEGLDESWLGRRLDKELLDDLLNLHDKYGVHLAFEGGEAETLVLDCPLFQKKINIIEAENIWQRDSGHYFIKKAVLIDK
ncbi:MAG: TIGR00289 family protein [Methanobacterium sp.]